MSSSVDVIFIHEGKGFDRSTPVTLMPMGMVSMADWLHRHGHRVQILHLPVESALDDTFDAATYVRETGATLACLDLHWHQQSYPVIERCRELSSRCTDLKIVLGGYTASAFAQEIMENYGFVDFVIRGDAELALESLVREVHGERRYARVPNLLYRRPGGKIAESSAKHVNTSQDLAQFRFASFELLRHQEIYNQGGMMEGRIQTGPDREPGIFYLNYGRGCPYNCLVCGGSNRSQFLIAGRQEWVFRPVDAMLADLVRMEEFNLASWYNTFNPSPDETPFFEIYEAIRAADLRINMIQEWLHIPGRELIDEFAATFGPDSRMDFVLLTGSDELRSKNKQNFFSNQQLMRCLEMVDAHGIRADLCFLTGLPFEEPRHVRESIRFAREARERFSGIGINAEILAIEPLSPMNLDAERCRITSHARTFLDYYHGHRNQGFIGYSPTSTTAQESIRDARLIRRAGREEEEPVGGTGLPVDRGSRKLVQLHDISLWDDVMMRSYGLGAPSLICHARSVGRIRDSFDLQHVPWSSGIPGGMEPTVETITRSILEARPDLVGFTLVTWSEPTFLRVIRRLKRQAPQVRIAVGGPLATGHGPRLLEMVPEIDDLVCGYGELAFQAILESMLDDRNPTKAPGLVRRVDGEIRTWPHDARHVLAPHEIPSPFRSGLLNLKGCKTIHAEWSRGCVYRCGYCSWSNALSTMKLASRERILDDIQFACEHGIVDIHVNNSTLNPSTRILEQMCDALREGGSRGDVKFTIFLRHEFIDERQLAMLRDLSLRTIYVGLQTDDPGGLRAINRPALDRRHLEWVVEEISKFARPGLQIISGIPGDTFDRFFHRLEWLKTLDCDLSVFPLQLPPGSRLYEKRQKMGLVTDPDHEYYVVRTREMGPRDLLRCLGHADERLKPHPGSSADRPFQGVPASSAAQAGMLALARQGKPLVQLHHANVYDAGMNFGLGVPHLISHCRAQPELDEAWEFEQVTWTVYQPDRFTQSPEQMVERILRDPPAVLGFSLQPWCYQRFLDVIRRVKKEAPDIPIVVGGGNATIEGGMLLENVPEIDHLVYGEGEEAFAALLRLMGDHQGSPRPEEVADIGNVVTRSPGGQILGKVARARKRSLDHCGRPFQEGLVQLSAIDGNLNVEWTRGCPNQCTYCSWPRSQRRFRRFGKKHIAADVKWAIEKGFTTALICDAAINYTTRMLRELCETLVKADPDNRISYSAFIQWYLLTGEHARIMSPLSWCRLMLGVQTLDEEGLKTLGRRPFDAKRFERTVDLLRPMSRPYVEFMTGVPGDTAEKIRRRIEYALSLDVNISVFPLLATRGTQIWRTCQEMGITMDGDEQWVVRELPTMTEDEYRDVLRWAIDLGLPPHELEIVGYDFLDPEHKRSRSETSEVPAHEVDGEELDQMVGTLLGRIDQEDLDTWKLRGEVQESRQANLTGRRLTFTRDRQTLSIDAYRASDLSTPLARGEHLAFCPAPTEGGQEPGAEEVRDLCHLLARLDGARR